MNDAEKTPADGKNEPEKGSEVILYRKEKRKLAFVFWVVFALGCFVWQEITAFLLPSSPVLIFVCQLSYNIYAWISVWRCSGNTDKLIMWIVKIIVCLYVSVFFFLHYLSISSYYRYKAYHKASEEAKNNASLREIPDAPNTLNAPPFSRLDGITLGMDIKDALRLIRKTHKDVEERDIKKHFSYRGSEIGERAFVFVSNSDDNVSYISVTFDTGGIDTFQGCNEKFQETLKVLIEKYGQPWYHITHKTKAEEGFNRYYFCFGNNTKMFYIMGFSFAYKECRMETYLDEGWCARDVSDFLEYRNNKEKYALEVVRRPAENNTRK